MIAQSESKIHYSPAEYLALEVKSADRHEYRDGEIILMTGGLPNHNKIAGSFYANLRFLLKKQPYEVYMTDQRLWIPRKRIHTYPDVMVMPQPLEYAEGRRDTLINPTLVAEVLSESTQDYDRGDKFAAYRTIPTFQEYVLISQTEVSIQHYIKTGNRRWKMADYEDPEEMLVLESVGCELAIADLYDKVEFNP